jgi:putative glutamine amidotransferase
MAKPPLILITPSLEKRGIEFQDLSVSLSMKYESAVLQAGGIPVITPVTQDAGLVAEAVRRADGVLLTGGDDINPELYDKNLPSAVLQTISQTPDDGTRDRLELLLIEEIFRQRKPLLAVCRGHQLINVALGGGLVADIRRQIPGALNHQQLDRPGEIVHEVTLTPGSLMAKITEAQVLGVNSSHHQAVLRPADPLVATGVSRDGIVEVMELKPEARVRLPFFLSVQFHPERLAESQAPHRAIFQKFTEASARNSRRKL